MSGTTTQATQASPLAETCEELQELATQYKAFTRQMTSIHNRALSQLRRADGWRWDMPEAERAALNRRAQARWAAFRRGEGDPATALVAAFLAPGASARAVYEAERTDLQKRMEALARTLPAWDWASGVRGLGAFALAVVVGEAGDLANYPGPRTLRKRLGCAPPAAYPAADSGARMMPRQRRSRIWVLTDSLLRSNRGRYRAIYHAECARQAALHPEWDKGATLASGKRQVSRQAELRARRKAEAAWLADLWAAWRGRLRPEAAAEAAGG